jgi:hypothetical protein
MRAQQRPAWQQKRAEEEGRGRFANPNGQQGGVFQQLRELPPAEQERFMANDPRFRQLPPQRQQMIRERLEHWNSLPPMQKAAAHQREIVLALREMPPQQQEQFMANDPRFLAMPPQRQRQIRQRIGTWNAMPAEQKDAVRERDEFVQLRAMPLLQQDRALVDDPRFLRLPPQRQEAIRKSLDSWNAMTAEQKEAVRQREQIFQGLSPEQRQEARNVAPQYLKLSPDRRKAIMQAFRQMRSLPPNQRQGFLASPEVREQFNSQERQVLDGLAKLLPNGRPSAPLPVEP